MRYARQKGLTFVELSLTLVILGLIAALLALLFPAITRLAATESVVNNVTVVDDAVAGFALATGRLPCADTNLDGYEDCPAVGGALPYLTLGMDAPLRNASGFDYRYGVYRKDDTAAPMNDVELTSLEDRWLPTIAAGLPPAASLTAFSQLSHLDLCRALGVGQESAVDTAYLYVDLAGAREHVAYVLVDPGFADLDGNGSLFDGMNGSGVGFEHPLRAASGSYDDTVSVVYFNDLWERLGCSGLFSPSGHAHPNVESTLAMFRQSMRDYKAQLEITIEMAEADIVQQAASIAGSTAALLTAGAMIPIGTASAINTAGATSPSVALAITAVTLNTAALALAVATEVFLVQNLDDLNGYLGEVNTLITDLDTLYASVQTHVRASDLQALSNQ